jgi:site-specific recombinase XerD
MLELSHFLKHPAVSWPILCEIIYDIRAIKDLLGHQSVKTTMTYLHVTEKTARRNKSPL